MTLQTASPRAATVGKRSGANAGVQHPHYCTERPKTQAANYLPLAMQQEALRYATNHGWQVLPVDGKKPAGGLSYSDASADVETIGGLFAAAGRVTGVGARMGGDLRLVAPEIDPKNGGTVQSFYKLAGVRMGEYKTPTMRTGGGGWAMICYVPDDAAADYGDLHIAKGIEIQGSRKMRILPPSVHPSGNRYQWVPGLEPWNVDVAPVPALLLDKIRAKTAHKAQVAERAAHGAQPGVYDLTDLKAMLDVLNPWQDGYSWWLSILMACHAGFGDDALPIVEAWAEGKPGEVADKWKSFKPSGGVTVATLAYHARAAGWQPPAADETDLPAAWRITADDWKACPTCAALHTDRYSDNSLVHHHNWCRRPTCPVYRKVKARDALRPVFGWRAVQTETVPAAAWRSWRKQANLRFGDNWRAVPLPDGARLAVFEVDAGGLNLDDVLHVAVSAILDNEAARRARRQALAFLNSLPENEALDPVTLARMKEALDVLASHKPAGNVSTPRRKRADGQPLEVPVKPARPHKVATLFVSKPWHRQAMIGVLNRLQIPWERRSYGGWRTDPLTDVQMLQVSAALACAVPGARVLCGALEAGSYAELSTTWPEDLPHSEREAALYALRNRVNLEQTLPLRR